MGAEAISSDRRETASTASAAPLHDLFRWLRGAHVGEQHLPTRVLIGCVAAEWGIEPSRAEALVDEALAKVGHATRPALVDGRDAAYVLASVDPQA